MAGVGEQRWKGIGPKEGRSGGDFALSGPGEGIRPARQA